MVQRSGTDHVVPEPAVFLCKTHRDIRRPVPVFHAFRRKCEEGVNGLKFIGRSTMRPIGLIDMLSRVWKIHEMDRPI